MVHKHFEEYRGHTAVKHAILKDYIGAWAGIMSRWNNRIIFIDGFCGPGYYKANGKEHDGSPIIAMQVADYFSKDCEMNCIFIDNDEEHCEKLEEHIKELGYSTKFNILCSTFEEEVSDLLEKVPNMAPAFCFIDPFGYSGIPLNLIKNFLERKATEVFINFMYEPISRFISVPSQHNHMDALFGTKKWRKVLERDLRYGKREEFLRDLYRSQLETCANYVWPFRLKNPDKDATMYYLFHCTNHPKGIIVMKEVMYRKGTVGTYSYQGKEDSQLSLFSNEPSIQELEAFLLDKFSGEKVTFKHIIESTVDAPFVEKHYRQALINLRKSEKIKKIPVTTSTVGRGFNGEDVAVFPRRPLRRRKR